MLFQSIQNVIQKALHVAFILWKYGNRKIEELSTVTEDVITFAIIAVAENIFFGPMEDS